MAPQYEQEEEEQEEVIPEEGIQVSRLDVCISAALHFAPKWLRSHCAGCSVLTQVCICKLRSYIEHIFLVWLGCTGLPGLRIASHCQQMLYCDCSCGAAGIDTSSCFNHDAHTVRMSTNLDCNPSSTLILDC